MNKIKKRIRNSVSVFIILILTGIILAMLPTSYDKYIQDDFEEEKILFTSEAIPIGEDTGMIITSISDYNDYYCITIANKTAGLLNNQHQSVISYTYYQDALEQTYNTTTDISNHLSTFTNKDNYGFLAGIAPISCKELRFDGIPANLVEQNIRINGKDYNFYLYYLAAENTEQAKTEYIDVSGDRTEITEEVY